MINTPQIGQIAWLSRRNKKRLHELNPVECYDGEDLSSAELIYQILYHTNAPRIGIMKNIYNYIEVEFDNTTELLPVINEYGSKGYEFVMMAQKMLKPTIFTKEQLQYKTYLIFKSIVSTSIEPKKQN